MSKKSKYLGLLVILLLLSFSVGCSDIINKIPFLKSEAEKEEPEKLHKLTKKKPKIESQPSSDEGTNGDEVGSDPVESKGETTDSTDGGKSDETPEHITKKKTEAPGDENTLNKGDPTPPPTGDDNSLGKGDPTPPPTGDDNSQKQKEEPKPVPVKKDNAKKDDNSTKKKETVGKDESDTTTDIIPGGEDIAVLLIGIEKSSDRADKSNEVFLEGYEYDARRRRDPFRPHSIKPKILMEIKKKKGELTPLDKFNTSQLIIKAIIYDSDADKGMAMVEIRSDSAKNKRGYNIYVGTTFKDGVVTAITPNTVHVEVSKIDKYNIIIKSTDVLKIKRPKETLEVKGK